MLPVKFIAATLGLVVFCAVQSNGQGLSGLSSALKPFENNTEIQACKASSSGCQQTYATKAQNVKTLADACPVFRGFLTCFANACNLDSEIRMSLFSTVEQSMRDAGVECQFDNGQPSFQKSGPGFILMASLITFGMFFFQFK
ncbi:hypothetical protein PoB_002327100 [Plakobranchus ocellatus]|uniref:Uncharacterized protein n=1 Tax=Plakobranchus ocellatus TaxID=259542 RepID=A0AAV3ZLE8_9GAST|nr:hypothetical protein PoB_002327100 [Plakobranchus ocellatus]